MPFQKGHIINKGRTFTEEHKRKISEKLKGKIPKNLKQLHKVPRAKEWRKNMSEARKGAKSHLWKGGISTENEKIRREIEYRLWREAVFARDNWTCQKYQTRGRKLVAHHIQNFADCQKLRFAIDNGITLSEKAHLEFHKIYGKENNTQEQLEEFYEIL